LSFLPTRSFAQGWMPIRFDLPGLGRNIGPLQAHQWQVDVAYRYLYTDQFYVGSEINDGAGPFGHGPSIKIHSWDFTINYGVSNRLSLALRFPFSAGTASRDYTHNLFLPSTPPTTPRHAPRHPTRSQPCTRIC